MGKLIGSEDAQHCVQDAPNAAVVKAVGEGIGSNMNALKNQVTTVEGAK
jgi:hypothetical protein